MDGSTRLVSNIRLRMILKFEGDFITEEPIPNVVDRLNTHNIPIIKEPMIVPGALGEMESVWFRDPDNNLIEISRYCQ